MPTPHDSGFLLVSQVISAQTDEASLPTLSSSVYLAQMLMATSVLVTKAGEEPCIIEGKNFRARRNQNLLQQPVLSVKE